MVYSRYCGMTKDKDNPCLTKHGIHSSGSEDNVLMNKPSSRSFLLRKLILIACYLLLSASMSALTTIIVPESATNIDLQTAVNQALQLPANEDEAEIILLSDQIIIEPDYNSPNPYQSFASIDINIGASNLTKLTIRGANANHHCAITMIPGPEGETLENLFTVLGRNLAEETQKIKFEYLDFQVNGSINGINGIHVRYGLDLLHIESCKFSKLRTGISQSSNYQNNAVRHTYIHSNEFYEPSGTGSGINFNPFNLFYEGSYSPTPIDATITISNNLVHGFPFNWGHIGNFSDDNLLINITNNHFETAVSSTANTVFEVNSVSTETASVTMTMQGNEFIRGQVNIQGPSGYILDNIFDDSNERTLASMLWIEPVNVASHVQIKRNQFRGRAHRAIHIVAFDTIATHNLSLEIDNNSFLNNHLALLISTDPYIDNGPSIVSSFTNNLFTSTEYLFDVLSGSPGSTVTLDPPIKVSHCFFSTYPNNPSFLINTDTCPVGDPQIVDNPDGSSYTLRWDETTMSPCIDAGTGYKDPDGSPADIGAVSAMTHDYWVYGFRDGQMQDPQLPNPKDTWHWVSYPVINTVTNGKDVAEQYFSALLGKHPEIVNGTPQSVPDVLQEILWRDTYGYRSISLSGSGWGQYANSHYVTSPQGYKIKLLPTDLIQTVPNSVTLRHSGFRTPAYTEFDITGSPNPEVELYENWIGYFDKNSAMPNTAFASIWNDIIFIQGKNWQLYRDDLGNLVGTMGTINDGDMVIVATYNNHSFRWVNNSPIPPRKKPIATAFNYEELPDYKPVYLNLSEIDTTDLKEIGLYLDGVCKGAVVVEDSLEMVCAYLDEDESLEAGEVELEFAYESKSCPSQRQAIRVDSSNMLKANIGNSSQYPVYHINVKSTDNNNELIPLSLEGNYPNPFNPETNIRYSIDKPGMVTLEIYNLKGQLVRTLVKGITDAGRYSAIWNGTDSNGKLCASGVYLYKLNTESKTMVQKMLMLK